MQVAVTQAGGFRFQISNTLLLCATFLVVYLTGGFGRLSELSVCPVETTLGTLHAPAPVVFFLEALNGWVR